MSHRGIRLYSHSYVVIPARLASTRLPRKLLLAETGKPLIQHTYEAAQQAQLPQGVFVAAADEEIAAAVVRFGGQVLMTDPHAASGTDRVAELARGLEEADVLVNVQGDEPEISGEAIDQLIDLLNARPTAGMATLATPIRCREKLNDPSCVKVTFNADGAAMYFSRSPIPHARQWDDSLLTAEPPCFYQHVGVYAYRREFLLEFASLPPSRLEQLECLEQLRALEAGCEIQVGLIDEPLIGIDTPEDYAEFVRRQTRRKAG